MKRNHVRNVQWKRAKKTRNRTAGKRCLFVAPHVVQPNLAHQTHRNLTGCRHGRKLSDSPNGTIRVI